MSDTIETVKVEADNEHGYKIINKSDMKESDRIYGEREERTAPKRAPNKKGS